MALKITAKQDYKVNVDSFTDKNDNLVKWANVSGLSVEIVGNYSREKLTISDIDTDTDGEFSFVIEKSFLQKNSYIYFIAELTQANADFSDGVENISVPIDLQLNVLD